jgi:hypothetical protein
MVNSDRLRAPVVDHLHEIARAISLAISNWQFLYLVV